MSYDPRAYGAQCSRCWLYSRRAGGPVPIEEPMGAKALIVGEAPGEEEIQIGRPFVGRSGHELFISLGSLGYRRFDFAITNAILCRPPGNSLEHMKYEFGRENKRRLRLNRESPGEQPYEFYLHPVEACRPRLLQELARYQSVIALGNTALKAVTGTAHTIQKVRGSTISGWMDTEGDEPQGFIPEEVGLLARPTSAKPVKILPTFHPAHVLRFRKWTSTFRGDLGRAMRWFTGQTGWVDPVLNLHPTPAELRAFLLPTKNPPPFFAYDLETDSKEPLLAKIRRFGIGTPNKVMVVPLRSTTDRLTRFYTERDEAEIYQILREWCQDTRFTKMSWNGITYDATVIRQQLKVPIRRHLDGIMIHHCIDSELPHNLGFVGTTMTDIVAWKQDSEDPLNCSDEELTERNWKDVAVTACLKEPLEQALVLKDQAEVCRKDHLVQVIAAGMHLTGMLVDPKARDEHDRYYLNQIVTNQHVCQEVVGKDFNPNSTSQLAELLFERWNLPPIELSEQTGAPSTGDLTLRTYLVHYNLTAEQRRVIEAARLLRIATKYRGTNILKLRPRGEVVPEDGYSLDEEETDEEREYRRKKDVKKEGILLPDGRIHSSWKALTKTGRMSSSEPSLQNWDRTLRNMIVAHERNVLVGADEDQLELRLQATIWGLKSMLEVFRDPTRDPHSETAMIIFGPKAVDLFNRATKWAKELGPDGKKRQAKKHPEWSNIRDFAKNLRYACSYGALDEKVHELITSTQDKAGNLIYADKTLAETRRARRALLDADPEYELAWESLISEFRHDGFLAEPIWGRKRYFLDGEDQSANEMYNFKIQSSGASLVNDATFELVEQIPFEKWGPGTGLIHQGHDALVVECPEAEGPRVAKIMTDCMTRRYPGLDVQFSAEAKIGKRWSDV